MFEPHPLYVRIQQRQPGDSLSTAFSAARSRSSRSAGSAASRAISRKAHTMSAARPEPATT